ncbi:MAG TPA: hypothetical protein VFA98_03895 [Thermoanaerobaculia bacterium]|jgi:hypothetical protein|nr:hypothetical protein [Thermoanaerobaculia bacterium]
MVSLAATLARRRIYYPRPVASLPDVLMIDIPRRFAGKRLPLGRFYPIVLETIEEQSEIEAFLAEERDDVVAPDLLDERPSAFAGEHLTIAHYAPSKRGWPFMQLCRWPAEFAARTESAGERIFSRGAYTFELFRDRVRLEAATKVLLESLERRRPVRVETVFPDWSADPGTPPH